MRTVFFGNHRLEIQTWSLTGKEMVKYDGTVVSEKRSMTGSTHVFQATEEDVPVTYEVEIRIRWHGCTSWVTVRRQGVVIYTDH